MRSFICFSSLLLLLVVSLLSFALCDITPNTTSISVTVIAKVLGDPFFGKGFAAQMTLNGQHAPNVTVFVGTTYNFSVNNPSAHPFYIGTSSVGEDNGFLYGGLTQGTFLWTPSVSDLAASPLFYQCENHMFMGNQITILPAVVSVSPSTSSSTAGSSSSSTASFDPPARVIGDPQFVGLRGQVFQVHGVDGFVYNLISDEGGLIINGRFEFLSSGKCPNRAAAINCWSHPGSYVSQLGVVSSGGDRLQVLSGGGDFKSVTVNDMLLTVGTPYVSKHLEVSLVNSYTLHFMTGNFEITVENSQNFLNLISVRVIDWSKLSSHGLLGQTWRKPAVRGEDVAEVEGRVDDYAEINNDLLGNLFTYRM